MEDIHSLTTTHTQSRRFKRPEWRQILPYLLIAPTLILVAIFTIYPTIRTFEQSLYEPGTSTRDATGRRVQGEDAFVGFQNYADLFIPQTPPHPIVGSFMQILGNTLIFAVVTVSITLPLSLGLALLMNRAIRGRSLWRFSLFYPVLLPLIGGASMWAFLYGNTGGLINTVFRSLGIGTQDWLNTPDLVLWSVIMVNIWKQAGFYMIFYLAGLQAIPKDIYEAAELDGASYFQQLYSITIPLLRRTTLFLLVIASTYAFQTVEQLDVLNRGMPANRSNMLLWYIYQIYPSTPARGYVNAISMVLVVILFFFTFINFTFFERKDDDGQ
ncbi:MAG: sugar ABC transporter permease [Phototrophicales bacterium]|nr:sugar ABC transporter permease [Phototrophicales bacterium]